MRLEDWGWKLPGYQRQERGRERRGRAEVNRGESWKEYLGTGRREERQHEGLIDTNVRLSRCSIKEKFKRFFKGSLFCILSLSFIVFFIHTQKL